jgi:hypothetical protein
MTAILLFKQAIHFGSGKQAREVREDRESKAKQTKQGKKAN